MDKLDNLIQYAHGSDTPALLMWLDYTYITANESFFMQLGLSSKSIVIGEDMTNCLSPIGSENNWFPLFSRILKNNPEKHYSSYYYQDRKLYRITRKIISTDQGLVRLETSTPYDMNINLVNRLHKRYSETFYFEDISLVPDIKLTDLEHKIISLLIAGFSLNDICSQLDYSRTYLTKIIGYSICHKFNVPGYSSKLLLDKLVGLNYYSFIHSDIFLLNNTLSTNSSNSTLAQFESKYLPLLELIENGFSQEECANKLNTSRSNIAKIVHSKLLPNVQLSTYKELSFYLCNASR